MKRVAQLKNDKLTISKVTAQRDSFSDPAKWIAAETWLLESRDLGRRYVYTQEVMDPVAAASRGIVDEVVIPRLSEKYLADAGRVARIRAVQASYRLAATFSDVIRTEL